MLAVLAVTAAYFAAAAETYAAEETGGTVTVDTTDDAKASARAAFNLTNNDVTSTVDGNTLTIQLKEDLVLDAPVRFVLGEPGKKVVLDLNNHTITGKAGIAGSDEEAARGGNAIEIAADEFDVEIQGPGSVIGGKGAVYETENHFKSGMYGGDAVQFVNASYYPSGEYARLINGLVVTGGAKLQGGDGADVSSTEWLYNIERYNGDKSTVPEFVSGSGGAGIGQEKAGLEYDNSLSYAKIEIEKGIISGGDGGNIDMHAFTPTKYALMTSAAAVTAMSGDTAENFKWKVIAPAPAAGRGGDGIRIGGGRKYINIGTNGVVNGSSCGGVDFGNNKYFCLLGSTFSAGDYSRSNHFQAGAAGDGIAVWVGDLGLTNVDPGFSGNEWQSRTAESNDMGLYVAGSVTGGSTPDVSALYQDAGSAGAGIALYGDYDLFGVNDTKESHKDWGIVDIEGTISGGSGGSSIAGSGGAGGAGIFENYNAESNDDGTNHYIINGNVSGGNGGNSLFTTDPVGAVGYGSGGFALSYQDNYRRNLQLVGNGTVKAGDAGRTTKQNGGTDTIENSATEALYLNPLSTYDYYENNVNVNRISGNPAQAVGKDSVKASASMTSFDKYPTTSTKVSCAVDKPTGYSGNVYIRWFASIQLQENDPVLCELEPSGTNPMSFTMLSNADYKYLAYPKAASDDLKNAYNYAISTTDRIKDTLEFKGSQCNIYCEILLEDGRWGKSNVMRFTTGSGWTNPSSSATAADQAAADKVAAKILLLSDPEGIGLYDESAIIQLRQEYNALTNTQKELIPQETLDRLLAAEAKVEELNQTAADAAATSINELLDTVPADLSALDLNDAAEIARVKQAIADAVTAYNNLSDSQKRLIDVDAKAKLDNAVTDFNSKFPQNAVAEPIAPGVERIKLGLCKITLSKTSYTYNGKAHIPAVTVKYGDKTLTKGKDYSVKYSANKYAGKKNAAKATITGLNLYTGTATRTFTINKAANTLRIYAKTAKIKYKKVKKKTQTLGVTKVITFKRKGQGTKTYYKLSGNKKITINKRTGKVTVKKKLKKGTYKVKVKVKAAGTANYKAVTRTITFKVRIR